MADLGIGAASLGIAVVALAAAMMQVTMQINVEARRKGKTDRLALGSWSVGWPQAKLFVYFVLRLFWLKSPWGDPRILTVPFITVGEIEKYLFAEAAASNRGELRRRIKLKDRLVEPASIATITGEGLYTGRMYTVRETTRKSCEACWSDAMDMCGITRKHWSLLSRVNAQACSGAIRPASAVTNLHSLWGFGRVMGLREVVRSGSQITMTNGGASLYLDLYTGVDRPTRLAHFSGSPTGRYMIIEEMSQHSTQSVYADGAWASGHVPDPARLSPGDRPQHGPALSQVRLGLPSMFPPTSLHVSKETTTWDREYERWVEHFSHVLGHYATPPDAIDLTGYAYSPAVVACIRTYPVGNLPDGQLEACYHALRWCTRNWPLCRYQGVCLQLQSAPADRPSLPILDIGYIGPEFVTGTGQAREWYSRTINLAENGSYAPVDTNFWSLIKHYAEMKAERRSDTGAILNSSSYIIIVRVLQVWKLELFDELHRANSTPFHTSPNKEKFDSLTVMLAAVTMASIAVATDSTSIGDVKTNKAMEIELGAVL